MTKAVVYALLTTAFVVFLFSSPFKQRGGLRSRNHDILSLNRRLGYKGPVPIFDPLVAKIENYAVAKETSHHSKIYLEHKSINMNVDEVEEVQQYVSDEGRLNITLRLMSLFPLLDQAPKDGFITIIELKHWVTELAVERLNISTQRHMASHDKDGNGAITFSEYLPQFTKEDLEKNEMEHGKAGWWKLQFDNADADKDGSLSFDEFKDLLHPEDSTKDEIHRWLLSEKIKVMDHDNDGKLNFVEFLTNAYNIYKNYIEFERAGANVPTAEEKFAELDLNKDKLLEVDELKPIVQYLHPGELTYANYYSSFLMYEADESKDGKLTLEEMLGHEYIFYNTVFDNDNIDEDYKEDHDEL